MSLYVDDPMLFIDGVVPDEMTRNLSLEGNITVCNIILTPIAASLIYSSRVARYCRIVNGK